MRISKLRELIREMIESEKEQRNCPRCGTPNDHDATKCKACKYTGGWFEDNKNKNESLAKKLYEQVKKYVCPPATQDVDLNTKNRNATREDHAYGPMNPLQPSKGYWKSLASKWEGATVEEAAGMRCGNCIAFDISPRMRDCMPISQEQYLDNPGEGKEIDPMDAADAAMIDKNIEDFPMFPKEGAYVGFGYCWMHHFKCHSARSCDTYAAGGPLATDEDSHKWQDKSPFQKDENENI